ncbi:hypothetical protein BH23ACI1_BH23ACI1_32030 [soil metagenome]
MFSLGAVLYECLTGQRPFRDRSSAEIAGRILHHDPPPVSSIRRELTEQHDELCRRLLAKHPADRFRSAEELLRALRVFPAGSSGPLPPPRPTWRVSAALAAAAVAGMLLAALGVWQWSGRADVFVASPDVQRLFGRGTQGIRDGAYHSGRRALEQAIAVSAGYVPAYVRLAEACSELDDHRCAQDALNTVATLTPGERGLSAEDRLRVRAVRALMLRRVDDTVAEYSRLAELKPGDAGAWVDLGRAQDTAALPYRARASFDRAIEIERDNAAAHLTSGNHPVRVPELPS